MSKTESHWMGRPLSELSREELIEACEYLGQQLEKYHAPGMARAYGLGRVEILKRGEVHQR